MTDYERGWQECAAAVFVALGKFRKRLNDEGLHGHYTALQQFADEVDNLKPDGGKSLAELEAAAVEGGRQEERNNIANDRDGLLETMQCGHLAANLQRDDAGGEQCVVCFELHDGTKFSEGLDKGIDIGRQEMRELMACGHLKASWVMPAEFTTLGSYCSSCQREKELVEECCKANCTACEIGLPLEVELEGRERWHQRLDGSRVLCVSERIRAKLGVNRGS